LVTALLPDTVVLLSVFGKRKLCYVGVIRSVFWPFWLVDGTGIQPVVVSLHQSTKVALHFEPLGLTHRRPTSVYRENLCSVSRPELLIWYFCNELTVVHTLEFILNVTVYMSAEFKMNSSLTIIIIKIVMLVIFWSYIKSLIIVRTHWNCFFFFKIWDWWKRRRYFLFD